MTVLALVELYISQKIGVKPSTRLGYKTVVNFLKKDGRYEHQMHEHG